jgi:hypothetical protein
MSDLLKEAIADAKAVRETALQNAKMALEEAFTPHLKSMLSAKLAEDEHEDEDENPFAEKEEDDEETAEGMHDSPRREDDDEEEVDEMSDKSPRREDDDEEEVDESEIVEIDGVKYAPIVTEDEHEDEEDEMDESEELDLEAVIKELEEELNETESDDDSVNEEEVVEEEIVTEEDDEDEDKDEVDEQSTSSGIGSGTGVKQPSAGDEEDPGKGKVHEQVNTLQSELNEYKEAVVFLKDKLHEVNILNAKLLYTNKLFKEFVLSNDQKLKIVETFDRAQTSREIKLVYSTLAESYTDNGKEKKEVVKESYASKKSGGTAPKTKIISEEVEVADRFRKLAGIIKS